MPSQAQSVAAFPQSGEDGPTSQGTAYPRKPALHLVPSPRGAAESKRYLFVNTVRFWSMAAIVALHCVNVVCGVYSSRGLLQAALTQPLKFGTIGFFLISGLLMGSRLDAQPPIVYLKRRLKRLVGPWILWFVLFIVGMTAANAVANPASVANVTLLVSNLLSKATFAIVYTPFWFVPNLIVGMICLLLCRRWINDLRFGSALLAVNLVYVANVYGRWFDTSHTEALFAFVLYLWLGAWSALHIDEIQDKLARLPAWLMPSLAVVSFAAAMLESILLQRLGSGDPLNTLRITNQVFSVVVVLWMVRLKRATWPASIDVPATTYGIHLIHIFAISLLVPVLHFSVAHQLLSTEPWMMLPILVAAVGIAYGGSLVVTRYLATVPAMAWTVGAVAVAKQVSASDNVRYSQPTLGLLVNSQG